MKQKIEPIQKHTKHKSIDFILKFQELSIISVHNAYATVVSVLIIFSRILQTVINLKMMSIGGRGGNRH